MNNRLMMTLLVTAFVPLVWGSTYVVTTLWLPENAPLFSALVRALPAGIVLVLFTREMPKGLWWGRLALLGALNIGVFFFCMFFAALRLPGGIAALVLSLQPLLVIVLSYFWLNSAITRRQIASVLVGISGVALLVLNSQAALDGLGLMVALLGSLSMATGIVLSKKWGRQADMSLMSATGWQLLFGGLLLLPLVVGLEGVPRQFSMDNLFGYSYLSVIGAMLAYVLWFRGIEKLPADTVSFLGFLSPVSAAFLGYTVLDQTFTAVQWLGAALILVAITIIALSTQHQKTSAINQLPIKKIT